MLVGLFVNFVMANTVFLHTHTSFDGHVVAHSHPYIPGAGHSHSGAAMESISGFNTAADTMEPTAALSIPSAPSSWATLYIGCATGLSSITRATSPLRGPPSQIIIL